MAFTDLVGFGVGWAGILSAGWAFPISTKGGSMWAVSFTLPDVGQQGQGEGWA